MTWKKYSLDQLGFVKRGKSSHRPRDAAHLYGGDYPFIQTADVKHSNLYITKYSQTYNESGLAQSRLWPKGTLCITIAANIADTAILGFDACFPDSIIGFIPDEKKADAIFIKYLFDALLQKQYKQFTQGAAQDNLSQSKLLSLSLPVPELDEQKRIGQILSNYDNLIIKNNKRIEKLKMIATNIFNELLNNKKLNSGDNIWETKKIKDFGQVITGKTPPTKKEEYYNGDIPFVKTPDMHNNTYIIESSESLSDIGANTQPKKLIPKNSILVSCIGTIGVVSINSKPVHTNQQINSIILKDTRYLNYLYFCVTELKSYLEGIGGGATMGNVNKSKFENIEIPMPDIEYVEKLNEIIDPIFQLILNLQLQNKNLNKSRDIILSNLMNGASDIE